MTFRETREGATPAVQYLVLPGREDRQGVHLSEGSGDAIAARTGATVMTEEGPISANSTASSTNAQGQVTEWQREQTTDGPRRYAGAGTSGVSQGAAPSNVAAAAEPAAEPAAAAAPEPAAAVAAAEPAPDASC